MKRFALLLYILTLCCSVARAIYFKHIGIKEGLSQLSVLSIYQDELGRMWFGTEEGLNLYDGVRVTAFKPTLSDVGNRVNLVRNRIILQKKFSEQRDFTAQKLASNPLDQKFIDTISLVVEQNLHNVDFDVNIMAREVGMSRSSLYNKFKVLVGMNPNEFVLSIRLKHAATLLLTEPFLQVAEVADRVGFGSPRYFARCFKTQYGVTPADYRKQNLPE